MAKAPKWLQDEIDLLGILIQEGLTNNEIAEIIGRSRNSVAFKAQRFFSGNPNYHKQKNKYKHLYEPVMEYFTKHSDVETMKHFGITERALKSIKSVGYKKPEFAHLRKDTRRHDAWSTEEFIFLLRHAGLKPRDWIAKKLKRGGIFCIKDRLESLGISSRTLNGITLSQYRDLFGKDPDFLIKTTAGPSRGLNSSTHWKIVPWVWLGDQVVKNKIKVSKEFRTVIRTMARFQGWIHSPDPIKSLAIASRGGHAFRSRL